MNSKRLHIVLMASLGLLLVALVGGTFAVSNFLSQEASNLTTLKAKSLALSQEQVSLSKAKKDIKQYADLTKIARAVVPEDKSQAEAVREIVNIAEANGIKLSAINFPSSTLGGLNASGAAKPGGATTPTPSAAAGGSKTDSLSQLKPVIGIVGVYQLTISVDSDSASPISYTRFINFLSELERNRRTAQVSTISIQPDKDNPALLTFSLSLNEYIKP
ncbi:MAG: hypothetical protein JWO35_389 [Candidatus Saccharibacteria bacterium]|nr:hypothetical protein [Candidatus Saccharibacteria bacterium]